MTEKKKLGELLIEGGLIDDDQLRSALAYQRKWGGRIGANLIKMGFLDEGDFVSFLSRSMRLPSVNLRETRVPAEVLALIPGDAARKYAVIPLKASKDKKRLAVAMADPTNLAAIDDLQFLVNARIDPVVASDSSIHNALRHYYENEQVLSFHGGFSWSTEIDYVFNADDADVVIIIDDDDALTGEPEPDFGALSDSGLDDLLVFTGGTEKTIALKSEPQAKNAAAGPITKPQVQPAARETQARLGAAPTPKTGQGSPTERAPAQGKAAAPDSEQLLMGLVRLLIDKGLITREELLARLNQK